MACGLDRALLLSGWRAGKGGKPPPREAMHPMGSSVYGSRVYEVLPIDRDRQRESHFQYEEVMLNWSAEDTAAALKLISYSLQNVCVWLRHWAGESAASLPLVVCRDDATFEMPWAHGPGAHTLRRSETVTDQHIRLLPDSDLLDILRRRQDTSEPPAEG